MPCTLYVRVQGDYGIDERRLDLIGVSGCEDSDFEGKALRCLDAAGPCHRQVGNPRDTLFGLARVPSAKL